MFELLTDGYQRFKAFMDDPLFWIAMYQIARTCVRWIHRYFYF